jgi:peptidoglycan hydrolase-like protein with peptidoglycan-binding domain
VHERLAALGHLSTNDAQETFGDGTAALVEAFQRSRGLPLSGAVDAITWECLIEASWRLGQRLLYLSQPNLRGDDVAELQVRLAQFGFNPGRIDGIFGVLTEEALNDFQRNCALAVSGTLTRATLVELVRMTSTHTARSLVTDARDRAGFHDTLAGPLVISGESPLTPLLARTCERVLKVEVLGDESPEAVAAFANTNAAAFVISLQTLKHIDGVHLHYWASYRSHSRRGEQLASQIATAFTRAAHLPRVEVTGMALPILRETKMITLHIEHGNDKVETLKEFAEVIATVLDEVIHRQA